MLLWGRRSGRIGMSMYRFRGLGSGGRLLRVVCLRMISRVGLFEGL